MEIKNAIPGMTVNSDNEFDRFLFLPKYFMNTYGFNKKNAQKVANHYFELENSNIPFLPFIMMHHSKKSEQTKIIERFLLIFKRKRYIKDLYNVFIFKTLRDRIYISKIRVELPNQPISIFKY